MSNNPADTSSDLPDSRRRLADPAVRNYAGTDETAEDVPADGSLAVHDSDEDILNEEKRHDIESNGPRDVSRDVSRDISRNVSGDADRDAVRPV